MKNLYFFLISLLLCLQSTKAQNGLSFNSATPDYISIGTAMNSLFTGTHTITLEGWVYQTANVFLPTIVGNYGTGMQFLLRIDNNKAAFWVDNGSGFNVVNGTTTIPLNTWVHIAGVWNGSSTMVYVNGVLDATNASVPGSFPTTANPVRIGANQTSEAMAGKLDGVRIWTTARTATEINTNKGSCLSGSETGLLALYNFEEGSGTTVADLTGHGYNGTFVGAPTWTTGMSCTAVLPISFENFSANKNTAGNVQLEWKVGTQSGIDRYEIERSADGRSFVIIGTIAATTSTLYNWLDATLLNNTSFYRIKSIAQNGAVKYTDIIKVSYATDRSAIAVWPNPVVGNDMHLQFSNQPKGKYELQLTDVTGRKIFSTSVQHIGGNSEQTITLPQSINNGIYQLIAIGADGNITSQKVFINNN